MYRHWVRACPMKDNHEQFCSTTLYSAACISSMRACQGTTKLHGWPSHSGYSDFVRRWRSAACMYGMSGRCMLPSIWAWYGLPGQDLVCLGSYTAWWTAVASLASGCLLGCMACAQVSHWKCYTQGYTWQSNVAIRSKVSNPFQLGLIDHVQTRWSPQLRAAECNCFRSTSCVLQSSGGFWWLHAIHAILLEVPSCRAPQYDKFCISCGTVTAIWSAAQCRTSWWWQCTFRLQPLELCPRPCGIALPELHECNMKCVATAQGYILTSKPDLYV